MPTVDEMVFRAIDDGGLTDIPKAPGDPCPNCEAVLAYDEGEPGEPPTAYCPDCGLEFEIDWGRQQAAGAWRLPEA